MNGNPFHPDLRAFRWLPPVGIGPRTGRLTRALDRLAARRPSPGVEVVRVDATTSVRLHRPARANRPGPALLWVHGGGYTMGAARSDDRVCRELADRAGVLVAAVDYRLAPGSPFPAALDDCWSALTWLAARPDVDASRLAVGGASAGGGLAAALALRARDREVDLVLQLLVYPMLDDRTAARPDAARREHRVWTQASNTWGWSSYLGRPPGSPGVAAEAAPARCGDLTGLAPAWIGVGSLDLLHDEDVDHARRLREAGVPCTLEVVPGAFHGFDVLAPRADVSRAFLASWVDALSGALSRS